MINNQFSAKLSEIIVYSKEEAIRLQNTAVGPEHLLLGILREGECKAVRMLQQLNADLKINMKLLNNYDVKNTTKQIEKVYRTLV